MKNIKTNIKKVTAGVLAVGMLVAGVAVTPEQAEATEATDTTTVICEEYTEAKAAEYWTTDSKTAPLKSGYVFGGWFRVADDGDTNAEFLTLDSVAGNYAPLTETEMEAVMSDEKEDTLYAKFVPAQVLSVKAQNGVHPGNPTVTKLDATTAESIDENNPVWVRVISSLDSDNYQKWGFDIYLANKIKVEKTDGGDCVTTKKYEGLLQGNASDTGVTEKDAEAIFGAPSDYVFVWQLSKINHKNNVSKIIYVRPYWYTMDGTKVLGLAKYVHMEDQYKGYISVPVNLLNGADVAAGTVSMTYNTELPENAEVIFETGRMFSEMSFYHDADTKTIQMVGSDAAEGTEGNGETIYANIRFMKPSADTIYTIDLEKFCDWTPKTVDMNEKWDIKYVTTQTTQE